MNILMLGTTFPRRRGDGVGRFVFELARALARSNRVEVLTTRAPGASREEVLDGVRVRRFDYVRPARFQRLTYPGGLPDQLKTSWLARLQVPFFLGTYVVQCARRMRTADIVVCNWIYTGAIMQAAMRLSRVKRACIVIVRGSDMRLVEKGGFLSRVFLRTLRRADAVCVVARDFADTLRGYGITQVHFTPNGIQSAEFGLDRQAARHALKMGNRPVVLYVGSLIDRKDVATLVRAMQGVDAVLAIVGEGECRPHLEQLARDLQIEARFAGAVPAGEVPLWMAAATVVVLPSLYEGRANVLIEAMASGRACVATRIKGSRELIADGETGFLAPVRSPEALRRSIQRLLDDPELRQRFEAAAAERVRTLVPTWEQSAATYLAIAETAVRGKA